MLLILRSSKQAMLFNFKISTTLLSNTSLNDSLEALLLLILGLFNFEFQS